MTTVAETLLIALRNLDGTASKDEALDEYCRVAGIDRAGLTIGQIAGISKVVRVDKRFMRLDGLWALRVPEDDMYAAQPKFVQPAQPELVKVEPARSEPAPAQIAPRTIRIMTPRFQPAPTEPVKVEPAQPARSAPAEPVKTEPVQPSQPAPVQPVHKRRPPNQQCIDCHMWTVHGDRKYPLCLDCLTIRLIATMQPEQQRKFMDGLLRN